MDLILRPGFSSVAAIGAAPNANGATVAGTVLTLQPASASFGGLITAGTQTIAGAKTFLSLILSQPAGAAGISLDPNAATGAFALALSPANLTAARRWSFPDRSDSVAGLGAQTFTGAQTFNAMITMPNGSTTASLSASGTDVNEVRGITVANNSGGSYYALSAMGNTGYGIANWPNSLVIEAIPIGSGNLVLGAYSNKIVFQTSARTIQALVISSNGDTAISSSTASTTTTTGALVVTGGVGVGGRLNAAGHITGAAGVVVTGGIPGGVLAANVSTMDFDGTNYRFIAAGPNTSTRGRIVFQTCASDISLLASAITIDATPKVVLNIQTVVGTDPGGSELLRVGGTLAVNSATLIKTYTTLTDGAAAAVGTLTNAPTAGNPTKWVLINDNGTIRKFPTWT